MVVLAFDLVNFITFLVVLLFFIFVSSKNTFKLLVVSELFWVTFYLSVLSISLIFDSILLLSLSFFFLMFSAAELSLGVSTFFSQRNIYQSLSTKFLLSNRRLFL